MIQYEGIAVVQKQAVAVAWKQGVVVIQTPDVVAVQQRDTRCAFPSTNHPKKVDLDRNSFLICIYKYLRRPLTLIG